MLHFMNIHAKYCAITGMSTFEATSSQCLFYSFLAITWKILNYSTAKPTH
jgi:hypothetical protein